MLFDVLWFDYHEPLTGNEEVHHAIVTYDELKKMECNPKIGMLNTKLAGT